MTCTKQTCPTCRRDVSQFHLDIMKAADDMIRQADKQRTIELNQNERRGLARIARARIIIEAKLNEIAKYIRKYKSIPNSYAEILTILEDIESVSPKKKN